MAETPYANAVMSAPPAQVMEHLAPPPSEPPICVAAPPGCVSVRWSSVLPPCTYTCNQGAAGVAAPHMLGWKTRQAEMDGVALDEGDGDADCARAPR